MIEALVKVGGKAQNKSIESYYTVEQVFSSDCRIKVFVLWCRNKGSV
jgi:hypothetical protein